MNAPRKIGSEKDLEFYERFKMETQVALIVQQCAANTVIKGKFGLAGGVDFENHPNTLSPKHEEVFERLQKLSVSTPIHRGAPSAPSAKSAAASKLPMHTDQSCVYNIGDNERIPAFIVEYKAPHKLTRAIIDAGLHDMNPMDDVVRRTTVPAEEHGTELFKYYSERLIAAIIAQTYSYMVESGLEYGYICTGEAFIFLQVPDNPKTIYYHLSVPGVDVGSDVLSACLPKSATTPVLAQNDRSERGEMSGRLRRGAEKHPRDGEERASSIRIPVNAQTDAPSDQVVTSIPAISCAASEARGDDNDVKQLLVVTSSRGAKPGRASERSAKPDRRQSPPRGSRSRMYCTQRCLLGLSREGRIDKKCPNVQSHQGKGGYHRLNLETFLRLTRDQLAEDMDTDCDPLWIQGSRGALFKVTLNAYGYTVAAKGTVLAWVSDLEHEASVYRRLAQIQGTCVPVYLGSINLRTPYLHGRGVKIIHMMLMAWGGDRIDRHLRGPQKSLVVEQAISSMNAIHRLGVIHQDALPRNMLWSEELQHVLFVDFERAEVQVAEERPPLLPISSNRKKKRAADEAVLRPEADNPKFGMLDAVKRQDEFATDVYEHELHLLRAVLTRAI